MLYKAGKKNNDEDSWRLYQNQRNLVDRLNKSNKINCYEKRLNKGNTDNDYNNSNGNNDTDCNNSDGKVNDDDSNHTDEHDSDIYTDKKMWSNVKQLTNRLKQIPPQMISHDNKVVTSISKITNIANNHYKNKVNNIRNKFTHNDSINPI